MCNHCAEMAETALSGAKQRCKIRFSNTRSQACLLIL